MRKPLAILLCAAMVVACSDTSTINEASIEFDPARTLQPGDTCSLHLTIQDNRKPYHLVGVLSANKSLSTIPLRITETDPFGDKTLLDVDVILSPKQQESGKLDEFEFTIDQHKQFHMHGEYKYVFEVRTVAGARVEEVTLVGLRVREQQPK